MKEISTSLRGIRLYYNLKQYVLAEKLGLSVSYLSQLESGKRRVSFPVLYSYAEVFDISMSSLFSIFERLKQVPKYKIHQEPRKRELLSLIKWINLNES